MIRATLGALLCRMGRHDTTATLARDLPGVQTFHVICERAECRYARALTRFR